MLIMPSTVLSHRLDEKLIALGGGIRMAHPEELFDVIHVLMIILSLSKRHATLRFFKEGRREIESSLLLPCLAFTGKSSRD